MPVVIRTYVGDGAPNITFTISREDGSIVNLTGATVRFIIQDPDTHLPTNNPTNTITNLCTIIDPANGICTYAWNPGSDTPDPGIYSGQIKIRYGNAAEETYGLLISAEPTIANAVIS